MNDVVDIAALVPPGAEVTAVWADGKPQFVPGVFPNMPSSHYFAIEAMSQSGAKKIRQSPLHYIFERTHRKAPTASMQFGTSVHDGVLEPDSFGARVCCVPPNAPKRPSVTQLNAKKPSPETIEAITYWQELDASNEGKIVLSADEFARSQACIAAVHAHPGARKLLAGAEVETSLFWIDGRYKVPCKARLDACNHGGIIDLKTTTDASPEEFARTIANFDYHAQGAHYISGVEHALNESPRFYAFITVETEPPHCVACYALPGNAVLAGQRLMSIALERYAEAMATQRWPGYPDTIETITLPRWATAFND